MSWDAIDDAETRRDSKVRGLNNAKENTSAGRCVRKSLARSCVVRVSRLTVASVSFNKGTHRSPQWVTVKLFDCVSVNTSDVASTDPDVGNEVRSCSSCLSSRRGPPLKLFPLSHTVRPRHRAVGGQTEERQRRPDDAHPLASVPAPCELAMRCVTRCFSRPSLGSICRTICRMRNQAGMARS